MAKETISQTEGLCKEVANCIRNAYDRGYKQGQKDMEQNTMAVLENGKMIGREDAWECARKIVGDLVEPHFESGYMVDIFRCESAISAMTCNSASEAIAKIKEYEEKQKQDDDEIKVGDEVTWRGFHDKGVVTRVNEVCCYVMWHDGSSDIRDKDDLNKTGKHIDVLDEILEQLKGE